MDSAIRQIIKDHHDLLLTKIAEKFSVDADELYALADSVMNTKPGRMSAPRKKRETVSAYLVFCSKMRETIKNESPEMKFGDVSKRLGEMWRMLTPEEKAAYSMISPPPPEENEMEDSTIVEEKKAVSSPEENEMEDSTIVEDALRKQLETSKISMLRKMCKNYGLDTSTHRQEMIQNILAHRATI